MIGNKWPFFFRGGIVNGGGVPSVTFAIGDIVAGAAAPSDGGTWFACDGSAKSQATYASLYALIGQDYYNWTGSQGTQFTPTGGTTGNVWWDGVKWLFCPNGGTQSYSSSDGLTWASAGTMTGLSNVNVLQGANGTTLLYLGGGGGTSGRVSSDSGANWTTVTFPVAPQTIRWNGTYFLLVTTSGQNTYSSTDGITWNTHSSVLPAAVNGARIYWDGAYWLLLNTTSGALALFETNAVQGNTGWSNVSPSNDQLQQIMGGLNIAINTSANLIVGYQSGVGWGRGWKSSNRLQTLTPLPEIEQLGMQLSCSLIWTGSRFLVYPNANVGFGAYCWVTTDGTRLNMVRNKLPASGTIQTFQGTVFQFQSDDSISSGQFAYHNCDRATGKFATFAVAGGVVTTNQLLPVLWTPTADTATQFCLPDFGTEGQTLKLWIKAL